MNPALLLVLCAAPSPELLRDFQAANDRALEGSHEAAIALYRSILERGGDSADVWFNLGNTYAESGRPVEAIVAWERTLRRAPGDPDALANLEVVRAQLAPKTAQADAPPVALPEVLEPFLAPISPSVATTGLLTSGFLGLVGALFRRRARGGLLRRAALLLLVASALGWVGSALLLGGHAIVAHDPRVVIAQNSELREGPNAKFKVRGPAWAGARATRLAIDGDWWQVRLQDGTSGWIAAATAQLP